MIRDPSSFCPDLYKSLSIELYNLNPCLQVLFFCPGPMAPKYEHRYATCHTIADDQELIFIVPFCPSLELAEFAAVDHGAMRIAFRFM